MPVDIVLPFDQVQDHGSASNSSGDASVWSCIRVMSSRCCPIQCFADRLFQALILRPFFREMTKFGKGAKIAVPRVPLFWTLDIMSRQRHLLAFRSKQRWKLLSEQPLMSGEAWGFSSKPSFKHRLCEFRMEPRRQGALSHRVHAILPSKKAFPTQDDVA